MWTTQLLPLLGAFLTFAQVASSAPLHTSSRWILDSSNQRVKLRCVNWAGHMEANIPEGLQHQSASTTASWISSNGFNCVRLTYSIDMALNPSQSISSSFSAAASPAGVSSSQMTSLYNSVVSKNSWASSSTTQGAFSKVIDELGAKGVMVILDNHVSRASWCCGGSDGNGWWDAASGYNADNSRYFNTQNWLKGLGAMASFAAQKPNVVGMSLRNELRASGNQDKNNHADWYNYVTQGAKAIHNANQDLLVVIGGTNYASDLGYLYNKPFDRKPFGDKIVWEFHSYAWTLGSGTTSNCDSYKKVLGDKAGYLLTQNKDFTGPLWLSEFGWAQQNTPSDEQAYLKCLVQYMENNDAEWAYWALQGDYYVRDKTINKDESYGLLNKDWSGWRNSNFKSQIGRMMDMTQGP
ncbi:glycoside hydrolase family 5 protein [Patellaria atrata CBS 101060]|uniref:Glycoside hydrolase family 5 protein n=1 Tax=Patellaria atrata CBS 101060 TaxID=1346257 RepID=A0A9P4VM81_9PEZI|nr:glycoside hydrolase family 5 protein [Patellaria atrata CBS 101060]